jgi:ribosome-associated heat shock protein Hsp15
MSNLNAPYLTVYRPPAAMGAFLSPVRKERVARPDLIDPTRLDVDEEGRLVGPGLDGSGHRHRELVANISDKTTSCARLPAASAIRPARRAWLAGASSQTMSHRIAANLTRTALFGSHHVARRTVSRALGRPSGAGPGPQSGSGRQHPVERRAPAVPLRRPRCGRPCNDAPVESTRIDRWLWAVRVFKSRTEATAACRGGHVRLNGARVKPAANVRVGDRVTARAHGRERIVEVVEVIDKRVGPPAAASCFVDHTPDVPPQGSEPAVFVRDSATGRPTKRDRRRLDRVRGR